MVERDSNPRLTEVTPLLYPTELSSGGCAGIEPTLWLTPPLPPGADIRCQKLHRGFRYMPRHAAHTSWNKLQTAGNLSASFLITVLWNDNPCVRMIVCRPCPTPGHSACAPRSTATSLLPGVPCPGVFGDQPYQPIERTHNEKRPRMQHPRAFASLGDRVTDLLWLKINRRCASALPARRHASAERGWRVAVGPVCWGDE